MLEAVYAVEKLPDANLRERLSSYLSLSARQIQVWFQNRRQRSKAKVPTRSTLSTSTQIMDALFEFSDDIPMEARARMAINAICNSGFAPDGASNPGVAGAASSPAAACNVPSQGVDDSDSFELSTIPGLGMTPLECANSPAAPLQPLASVGPSVNRPSTSPSTMPTQLAQAAPSMIGLAASLCLPPPMLLEAIMGFACHVLSLDAIDYWQAVPALNGAVQPALAQSYAPEGALALNELASCRSLLAAPLTEVAACTRAPAWFGSCKEQQDVLERLGIFLRTLIGVPCEAPVAHGARAAISGILVLYARPIFAQAEPLNRFLDLLSAVVGCACPTTSRPGMGGHGGLEPRVSYTLHPQQAPVSTLSWLLLVSARALQADVAEHWVAKLTTGGTTFELFADRVLSSTALQSSAVVLHTGTGSEAAHAFSSQMCRAALYAGKLVWCNATHPSGVLEGVKLPMKTVVGIPVRADSRASVLVLYSLRRLEQTATTSDLISQLQLLAAASGAVTSESLDTIDPDGELPTKMALAEGHRTSRFNNSSSPEPSDSPPASDATTVCVPALAAETASSSGSTATLCTPPPSSPSPPQHLRELAQPQLAPCRPHSSGVMPAPCAAAPTSVHTACRSPASVGTDLTACDGPAASCREATASTWEQLSTEQVLTLIDHCLGDESQPQESDVDKRPTAGGVHTQVALPPFFQGVPLQRTGCSGGLESLELSGRGVSHIHNNSLQES